MNEVYSRHILIERGFQIMKNKKIITALFSVSMLIGVFSTPLVSAATIDLDSTAPQQGSVILDDHDNLLASSSEALTNIINGVKKDASTMVRDVVNVENGRWVYFSDHHNYFNGYKWGHSNYLNKKQTHSAYAKIGGNSGEWVRKTANNWAYNTKKGYGTFVAKYRNS